MQRLGGLINQARTQQLQLRAFFAQHARRGFAAASIPGGKQPQQQQQQQNQQQQDGAFKKEGQGEDQHKQRSRIDEQGGYQAAGSGGADAMGSRDTQRANQEWARQPDQKGSSMSGEQQDPSKPRDKMWMGGAQQQQQQQRGDGMSQQRSDSATSTKQSTSSSGGYGGSNMAREGEKGNSQDAGFRTSSSSNHSASGNISGMSSATSSSSPSASSSSSNPYSSSFQEELRADKAKKDKEMKQQQQQQQQQQGSGSYAQSRNDAEGATDSQHLHTKDCSTSDGTHNKQYTQYGKSATGGGSSSGLGINNDTLGQNKSMNANVAGASEWQTDVKDYRSSSNSSGSQQASGSGSGSSSSTTGNWQQDTLKKDGQQHQQHKSSDSQWQKDRQSAGESQRDGAAAAATSGRSTSTERAFGGDRDSKSNDYKQASSIDRNSNMSYSNIANSTSSDTSSTGSGANTGAAQRQSGPFQYGSKDAKASTQSVIGGQGQNVSFATKAGAGSGRSGAIGGTGNSESFGGAAYNRESQSEGNIGVDTKEKMRHNRVIDETLRNDMGLTGSSSSSSTRDSQRDGVHSTIAGNQGKQSNIDRTDSSRQDRGGFNSAAGDSTDISGVGNKDTGFAGDVQAAGTRGKAWREQDVRGGFSSGTPSKQELHNSSSIGTTSTSGAGLSGSDTGIMRGTNTNTNTSGSGSGSTAARGPGSVFADDDQHTSAGHMGDRSAARMESKINLSGNANNAASRSSTDANPFIGGSSGTSSRGSREFGNVGAVGDRDMSVKPTGSGVADQNMDFTANTAAKIQATTNAPNATAGSASTSTQKERAWTPYGETTTAPPKADENKGILGKIADAFANLTNTGTNTKQ